MAIIKVPGVGNIGVGANSTNGKITQEAVTPVPTWQDKLTAYKTDKSAAEAEIERAKGVYAQKQKAGDTAGMAAANKWANQVRDASGISVNDSVYGNNKETFGKPVTPVTPVVTPVVPVNPVPEVVVNNGGGGGGGGGSSSTTTSPTNEYINKVFEAQQKANVEKFYQARNQAAAQNQQQVRNFAEYMANRGLTGSGAGAQSAISQSGVYQANIGSLLGQEAQAQADIGANQAKASLDQFNTDRNFALQEAGLTGQYQGKETLAGTKARLENIITEAKASTANAVAQAELKKIETDVETGKMDLATATAKAKNIATQIKNENALAVAKINTQNATTTKVGAQTGQAKSAAAASAAAAALSKAKAGQVGKTPASTPKQKTYNPSAEVKTITDLYTTTNPDTKTVTVSNKTGAAVYILGLQKTYGLTNQQVDALAKRFGLKDKDFTNAVK